MIRHIQETNFSESNVSKNYSKKRTLFRTYFINAFLKCRAPIDFASKFFEDNEKASEIVGYIKVLYTFLLYQKIFTLYTQQEKGIFIYTNVYYNYTFFFHY